MGETDGNLPSRRELLRTLVVGSAVAVGGAGTAAADTTDGTVVDVFGDPVPGVDVDVLRVTDHRRILLTTVSTDENGRFELDSADYPEGAFDYSYPDQQFDNNESEGHVVLIARLEPDSNDEDGWFGMERYASKDFEKASSFEITLDSRRLFHRGTDRAVMTVWQEVAPRPDPFSVPEYPHRVHVEVRGKLDGQPTFEDRWPDRTDSEYGGQLRAGTVTLQTPESVDIKYASDTGGVEPTGTATLPEPRWTGGIGVRNRDGVNRYIMEEAASLSLGLWNVSSGGSGGSTPSSGSGVPMSKVLQSTRHLIPYNDGEVQREANETDQLIVNVLGAFLSLAGTVFSGGTAFVILTALGMANSWTLSSFLQDDSKRVAEWVRDGTVYGDDEVLPVDADSYDFAPSQWVYNTFAYTQSYPLNFSGQESQEFTVRGVARSYSSGLLDSDNSLHAFQKAFSIDPSIYSPLDEEEQPEPGSTVPASSGTPGTLPVDIGASDYTPKVNREVSFDVTTAPSEDGASIEEYDWEIAPLDPDRNERTTDTGAEVTTQFSLPGDYAVTVTVTDSENVSESQTVFVTAEPGPPAEVYPVATDAGGECVFPPTGERFPATGSGAASHFGYGCGDWKVYEVQPGAQYTVRSAVDGCSDCVLYDAAYVVEEPAPDAPAEPEDPGDGPWEVVERVEDPKGKGFAGEVHELSVTPDADRIRVRNVDGNAGMGFYASVFASGGGSA